MYGPPDDVEGKCNARLYLGDDMGDNYSTFICLLELGHKGPHEETFNRSPGECTVSWEKDESALCSNCRKRVDASYLFGKNKICFWCREQIKHNSWNAFGVIYGCPYPEGSWQYKEWMCGYKFMVKRERDKRAKEKKKNKRSNNGRSKRNS